jgi:hypothetical protein
MNMLRTLLTLHRKLESCLASPHLILRDVDVRISLKSASHVLLQAPVQGEEMSKSVVAN